MKTLVDCDCRTNVHSDGSGVEICYCALHQSAPLLLDALRETLRAYQQLMPGLIHIAIEDYANINEAPIHAREAIAAAEDKSYFKIPNNMLRKRGRRILGEMRRAEK